MNKLTYQLTILLVFLTLWSCEEEIEEPTGEVSKFEVEDVTSTSAKLVVEFSNLTNTHQKTITTTFYYKKTSDSEYLSSETGELVGLERNSSYEAHVERKIDEFSIKSELIYFNTPMFSSPFTLTSTALNEKFELSISETAPAFDDLEISEAYFSVEDDKILKAKSVTKKNAQTLELNFSNEEVSTYFEKAEDAEIESEKVSVLLVIDDIEFSLKDQLEPKILYNPLPLIDSVQVRKYEGCDPSGNSIQIDIFGRFWHNIKLYGSNNEYYNACIYDDASVTLNEVNGDFIASFDYDDLVENFGSFQTCEAFTVLSQSVDYIESARYFHSASLIRITVPEGISNGLYDVQMTFTKDDKDYKTSTQFDLQYD